MPPIKPTTMPFTFGWPIGMSAGCTRANHVRHDALEKRSPAIGAIARFNKLNRVLAACSAIGPVIARRGHIPRVPSLAVEKRQWVFLILRLECFAPRHEAWGNINDIGHGRLSNKR